MDHGFRQENGPPPAAVARVFLDYDDYGNALRPLWKQPI